VTILSIGLSYSTAPVALRERLYLNDDKLRLLLNGLSASTAECDEWVMLSTCNRHEIYANVNGDLSRAQASIIAYLCHTFDIAPDELQPHLYLKVGADAVYHLMCVACGLESMVLGETQILGQVGDALTHARNAGACGAVLHRLFTDAVHAGKRARSETVIGQHTTSVSHVAALMALKNLAADAPVLVVGAGEMAETAAQALIGRGVTNITVLNRTYGKALDVAEKLKVEAVEWSRLWELLATAQVVITATGAPHGIFEQADIQRVMEVREGKPLTFIDIAVPRDVSPEVRVVPGVSVYDIDDLQQVVDEHLQQRRACIPAVEAIIREELAKYTEWLGSRRLTPVIKDLRQMIEGVVQTELSDAMNRLDHLPESDKRVLERFAHRVVNKLLHTPTNSLRSHASQDDLSNYTDLVRELFALSPVNEKSG
jgi:glutamyl-tRNA reductase